MPTLAGRFRAVPVANLSDVRGSFGVLDPAIRPVVPGLAGRAFTVQCYPGSIITVHQALNEAQPGDILVVDGEGDMRGALFGELMAMDTRARGLGGVVIDGPVRDVDALLEIGLPVYARGLNPRVGTNRRVGKVGLPVSVGGVVINPGDWVVGDRDGVIAVAASEAEAALAAAEKKHREEAEIAGRIRAGERLVDILGFRDLLYPKK